MERRGLRTEEYRVTPTHKTNIFLSLPEKVLIKFVSTEKLTYLASLTSRVPKRKVLMVTISREFALGETGFNIRFLFIKVKSAFCWSKKLIQYGCGP